MKKICFVTFDMCVVGGVEQVTSALASSLVSDYEVHLVSFLHTSELKYKLDERVKYTYFETDALRISELRKKHHTTLYKYFEDNDIDVAFIQGNYSGYISYNSKKNFRTKIVFCDHGAILNQIKDIKTTLARILASRYADKIVTLTERNLKDYKRLFLVPERKLTYIYNWIDTEIAHSVCYNADSKRIVSAGRFSREKGFDLLIKAFAPVAKRHPDWTLDIFGDGEFFEQIKAMAKEYGVSDNINFLGMRSDLRERYGDYAMYVLPSYHEGLPLVLLEAKLNRLPIVSFDIRTGPSEIVENGKNGILVEPYDTEKMADAVCQLIENSEKRQKMSDAASENIEKFSKETIKNRWKALIEELTNQ